jgi:hypothetical protein
MLMQSRMQMQMHRHAMLPNAIHGMQCDAAHPKASVSRCRDIVIRSTRPVQNSSKYKRNGKWEICRYAGMQMCEGEVWPRTHKQSNGKG